MTRFSILLWEMLLICLVYRLKATGVMNVMNPVENAAREGRFEELE